MTMRLGLLVLCIVGGVLIAAEERSAEVGERSWRNMAQRARRSGHGHGHGHGQLFICPLPPNWAQQSSSDSGKQLPMCDWSSLAALRKAYRKNAVPRRRSIMGSHKHHGSRNHHKVVTNDGESSGALPRHQHHHHYHQYHYQHQKRKSGEGVNNAKRQSGITSNADESKSTTEQKRSQTVAQVGPAVKVDVYYETLCPDSRSFIATQLMPTVNNFPPEVLDVTLIPYGKASTHRGGSTGYEFDCQHGPLECDGNKVHACAIAYNRRKDARSIARYVNCMIHNNRNPMEIGKKCNEELNYGSWDEIANCASGKEGSQLLAKYGDMTHDLNPRVDFIPTVIINGKRSEMWKALKNLKAVVCDAYQFTPMERDQYC